MTDEEETINWINERKKGSDLMSKLLNKYEQLEKENEQWKQEWQDAQIKANEEGFARTQLQIKYSKLEKENAELKKKLCMMRKYIYGNYDLEYKEMQLQHIDEFGTELKVVRNDKNLEM